MRTWHWRAFLLCGVAVCATWAVRVALWPCGVLDRNSGCMASVPLDAVAAGFDPGSAEVDYLSFDLGPGGAVAVIGLKGRAEGNMRSVLGVFDTATGALQQVLRSETLGQEGATYFREVAFSPDGTRVAAFYGQTRMGETLTDLTETTELVVYDAADGSIVTTIFSHTIREDAVRNCTAMLDFTADGAQLQCGGQLFDLASGVVTSLSLNDQYIYPMPADFSPGNRAPDGTVISAEDLDAPVALDDATSQTYFAPDSAVVLEMQVAYFQNRGLRWWIPAAFRRLSVVTVWDARTRELLRSFTANRRYADTAWARDGSSFGVISKDLQLEVFER